MSCDYRTIPFAGHNTDVSFERIRAQLAHRRNVWGKIDEIRINTLGNSKHPWLHSKKKTLYSDACMSTYILATINVLRYFPQKCVKC